jgi:predicted CoA-binding protein
MKTIAILGASANRAKYGNKAVRAYAQQGYRVLPIHPHESHIEGLAAYPSIQSTPAGRIDRVSVYLPPEVVLGLLDGLAGREIGEIMFNPGSENDAVLEKARSLGFQVLTGCSILAVGVTPDELD